MIDDEPITDPAKKEELGELEVEVLSQLSELYQLAFNDSTVETRYKYEEIEIEIEIVLSINSLSLSLSLWSNILSLSLSFLFLNRTDKWTPTDLSWVIAILVSLPDLPSEVQKVSILSIPSIPNQIVPHSISIYPLIYLSTYYFQLGDHYLREWMNSTSLIDRLKSQLHWVKYAIAKLGKKKQLQQPSTSLSNVKEANIVEQTE